MKSFRVTTTIAAPPQRVWDIITDGERAPEWDPNLLRIEGRIAPDELIKVFTKMSPERAFPVKVVDFDPPRGMRWTGGMPLGLFAGNRTFTLTPLPDGGTAFHMEEVFSGLMAPLITRSIPDLSDAFQQYAAGLKARAERG
ncbi:MAG: SRPBCC domain-containing protein [Deltaproteobacteria bacterium]|nr:SRPBCC domain-containing protein [Deltaproteobacteria bacterium]